MRIQQGLGLFKKRCIPILAGMGLVGMGLILSLAAPGRAVGDSPLPPPPATYVYDEPHILKPQTLAALQTLLATQNQKTGQQVVFSIFNTLGDQDLVDWTNRIFHSWKIGQKGKDDGVLLALYWKNRKVRIEVGYGLEPLLTDAKTKRIIAEDLLPFLKEGKPDDALESAALAILREIQSPLIQNGEALKILKQGGSRSSLRASSANSDRNSVVRQLFIFGLLIIIILILNSTRRNRGGGGGWGPGPRGGGWDNWNSGGGSSGGGGGGFSGGGGSSGGGGASGEW